MTSLPLILFISWRERCGSCPSKRIALGLTVEKGANPFFADPLRLKRTQVLQADLKHFAGLVETLKPLALE